jgi:CubicO group peptidase (beta-lactamase class C family)
MIPALVLVLGLLLALAAPALAQDAPPRTVDGIEQTFARWVKQHNVARATLAVARGDRLVLAKGYGGLAGDSRVLLASLSKAITATCTTTLIDQGTLRFDTPLAEFVERWTPRWGAPADPRLRTVTIAQLLTHRAGFARPVSDPVTGNNLVALLTKRPLSQVTMHDLVRGLLRTKLTHEPGAGYAYTNAPHLLLALVIETVTGRPYEGYCADAVLRPQGIAGATLHPRWAVIGPVGGWSLSGPEYLAFLRVFPPSGNFLSAATRRWLLDPEGKEITTDGSLFYSLLFVRPLGGGHNFFHMGSWGYRQAPAGPSGGINDSVGTLAATVASGASWFVSFEPRPGSDARARLDRDLVRAAETVTSWPDGDLYPRFGVTVP